MSDPMKLGVPGDCEPLGASELGSSARTLSLLSRYPLPPPYDFVTGVLFSVRSGGDTESGGPHYPGSTVSQSPPPPASATSTTAALLTLASIQFT